MGARKEPHHLLGRGQVLRHPAGKRPGHLQSRPRRIRQHLLGPAECQRGQRCDHGQQLELATGARAARGRALAKARRRSARAQVRGSGQVRTG